MMSDFKEKVIILRKIQVTMKTFSPPFFNHFSLSLSRTKRVAVRAMRKKLTIFTLQLPIYCILEQEISIRANADIAKSRREKRIAFAVERWMQCLLLQLKSSGVREASCHPAYSGKLPDYQSHVLALSTYQMSSSFCSWCIRKN